MRNTLFTALCVPLAVNAQLLSSVTDLLNSLGPAPADDPRFKDFHPPGTGDVRPPCPGLHALANHDFYFGNDYTFYQPNWNMVLKFFKGSKQTTIPTAAAAKYARVMNSNKTNPTFTYGIREAIFSYGESAIYLQTMSSPSANGVANVNYVRTLFEQERLPYKEGWRPSPEPITLASLGALVLELYTQSPQPAKEGLKITAESYKDAFIALIGSAKFFSELTGDICSAVGLC